MNINHILYKGNSARQPMFSSHQFEDDGVNIMIKHRYLFGLNSISNNRLIEFSCLS